MLIDTHCHLDFPELETDLEGVLARARAAEVAQMITISTRVARYEHYRALAERQTGVYFTVGTHPHNADEEPDVTAEQLATLSEHPLCVGIGEAGLDYHYDRASREGQQAGLRAHIEAAQRTQLPLIIHARNADEDMSAILREAYAQAAFPAVLHCFSSGAALAACGLELGFYLSFSGIVTFKASDDLRDVVRSTPVERILVETDAPYLAPVPHRGRRNEPSFLRATAEHVAHLKDMTLQNFADVSSRNARVLFRKLPTLVD